jgi:hypothetical protein
MGECKCCGLEGKRLPGCGNAKDHPCVNPLGCQNPKSPESKLYVPPPLTAVSVPLPDLDPQHAEDLFQALTDPNVTLTKCVAFLLDSRADRPCEKKGLMMMVVDLEEALGLVPSYTKDSANGDIYKDSAYYKCDIVLLKRDITLKAQRFSNKAADKKNGKPSWPHCGSKL